MNCFNVSQRRAHTWTPLYSSLSKPCAERFPATATETKQSHGGIARPPPLLFPSQNSGPTLPLEKLQKNKAIREATHNAKWLTMQLTCRHSFLHQLPILSSYTSVWVGANFSTHSHMFKDKTSFNYSVTFIWGLRGCAHVLTLHLDTRLTAC